MRFFKRPPDFVIGKDYLRRWYVIPRNRFFNIYLHRFGRSDDDRAMHDHSYLFNVSILLKGSYIEHTPGRAVAYRAPAIKPRWGRSLHRIELFRDAMTYMECPTWTLFITGPRVREWGFECAQGWRHNEDFIKPVPGGNEVGRGCD